MRQQKMKPSSKFRLCSGRPKTTPNTMGWLESGLLRGYCAFYIFRLKSEPTISDCKAGLHASTTRPVMFKNSVSRQRGDGL